MAKKDISQANTGSVYDTIAAATSAEAPAPKQKKGRKMIEGKNYDERTQAILDTLKTSGKKGEGLPRINMAFAPEAYEYIRMMARVSGISLTEFVNLAIIKHMYDHEDIYKQARAFRELISR